MSPVSVLSGGRLVYARTRTFEVAPPEETLERTQAGLLYADDFADLSGWTVDPAWAHRDEQTLVSFGHFPRPFYENGGIGSLDVDGVREGQLFIDDDDTWWLLYDGGDHSTGWQNFLASSTDRGLTWTRHGRISIGLTNGAGGSWAALATGWLEKRGSTYYLHRVTTNVTVGGSLPGLPNGPYRWDTWSAAALPGPWTWVRNVPLPAGVPWAVSELLPCAVVKDGATYYAFGQGAYGAGFYAVGYGTSSSPTGPWTFEPTVQFNDTWFGESRYPENVKVFWHPGIGKWVTIGNVIAPGRDLTDRNFVAISDDVADWSTAQREYNQSQFPMDTDTVAVGVQTHLTGPDGELLYHAPTGNVPVVYDASGSVSVGRHLDRTIYASELELSPGAAQFDSNDAVAKTMVRALAHDDVEVEFAVKYRSNVSGSSIAFWFRCNAAMTNGYRLVVRDLGTLLLQKIVGGVVTTVYSNPGSSPYLAQGPLNVHRIRFRMIGSSFKAWQDGQLHIDTLTDTSHASGTHVAIAGYAAHAEVRKVSIRTGVTNLVVNGVGTSEVVLRSYGGLPVDVVTGVADTATFTGLTHGPYGSVEVDGIPYTAAGGIWPGDILTLGA